MKYLKRNTLKEIPKLKLTKLYEEENTIFKIKCMKNNNSKKMNCLFIFSVSDYLWKAIVFCLTFF